MLNKNFINRNIENQTHVDTMILDIKNNYEDNWKSINKMDPSSSVPIRLSVNSTDIAKSLELENVLKNLDFVNNYKIEKFNSKEIVYKVYYTSSPKRFLKDILAKNIIIDTSTNNWRIK